MTSDTCIFFKWLCVKVNPGLNVSKMVDFVGNLINYKCAIITKVRFYMKVVIENE